MSYNQLEPNDFLGMEKKWGKSEKIFDFTPKGLQNLIGCNIIVTSFLKRNTPAHN
jgi:hypothetical protein